MIVKYEDSYLTEEGDRVMHTKTITFFGFPIYTYIESTTDISIVKQYTKQINHKIKGFI